MIDNLRDQFPIFKRQINGKPLVFLDSAASAQKPQVVIDAMTDFMQSHYANINRGVYTLSEESTAAVEESRAKVSKFIGSKTDEIIFTRNATESINLVAYSWARHNLVKDDVVVISEMEHHSNIVPWQILSEEIGIEIKWISVDENGYLEWENFREQNIDTERIKLISVTHVSNVLGTINPVREICDWGHRIGAKVLIDGSQAVTNFEVDVKNIDCDWYVFSGHKLYGPTGVGVLYGKKEILESMPTFLSGGDMILEVHRDKTTFQDVPQKFEAGTPAIVEIVGLGAAVDFVSGIGMGNIEKHNRELVGYLMEKIEDQRQKIKDKIKLFGPVNISDKVGVVSFIVDGIHAHDIASILNEDGIAVRSGHHCAQPLCDRFSVSAMVRVSFGVYNTKTDIDKLVDSLKKAVKVFE
jgi:cysteine desulfurase/selenocysteine lyase